MDTQRVTHWLLHRASGDTKHCSSYPHWVLTMLAQVGVCGEERLPGEGGGHPVVSHHQAERCHDDQQLWERPSPVEPWGLLHTSECEPAHLSAYVYMYLLYVCVHVSMYVHSSVHPSFWCQQWLWSSILVDIISLGICLHRLNRIERPGAVIYLTFCASVSLCLDLILFC